MGRKLLRLEAELSDRSELEPEPKNPPGSESLLLLLSVLLSVSACLKKRIGSSCEDDGATKPAPVDSSLDSRLMVDSVESDWDPDKTRDLLIGNSASECCEETLRAAADEGRCDDDLVSLRDPAVAPSPLGVLDPLWRRLVVARMADGLKKDAAARAEPEVWRHEAVRGACRGFSATIDRSHPAPCAAAFALGLASE